MYTDIGKYYYRKAVKQDDSIKYEVVDEKEEKGYIVSVSQTYTGCKNENEMKLRLVKDLREEADKIETKIKVKKR